MGCSAAACIITGDGAQNYLDVMSYLSTGMKHCVGMFDVLTDAFAGHGTVVLQ